MTKGDVQEAAKGELGDNPYFGGETLGFMDIALIPYHSWFYSYETCGNFSVQKKCPKLMAWAQRCLEKESVSKSLLGHDKIYEYVLQLRKRFGVK